MQENNLIFSIIVINFFDVFFFDLLVWYAFLLSTPSDRLPLDRKFIRLEFSTHRELCFVVVPMKDHVRNSSQAAALVEAGRVAREDEGFSGRRCLPTGRWSRGECL